MVDVWPVGLPQKMAVQGFSEQLVGDGLLESNPDAGPPLTRRRSSAGPRPVTATFQCTKAQLATLRTFVFTTIGGGALPFNLPGQSESGTWLVKFQKGGLPKDSALGGNWYNVSMALWILP